jgi:NhaP-type Na+/H+ or K+/H+ antiporter
MAQEHYFAQDEDALIFMFLSLFLGAVVTYLITRYLKELHYTVILFFLGVVIAVGFSYVDNEDLLKISVLQWEAFSGELIIYIFLPALLFSDAMTLNFYHVLQNFRASALLAGPGALITAFLTAVFVRYCLPYHWGWSIAFLFGAITCPTDAVGKIFLFSLLPFFTELFLLFIYYFYKTYLALVGLLKAVGANNSMTYVITGETLNEATSLVLFTIFYELLKIEKEFTVTIGFIVRYAVKVLIVSPLIGFIFGGIAIVLIGMADMRHKEEDTTIQLAITFCCAYFSFYVAQRVLLVSGVLACVMAGVLLSRYAVPRYLKAETIESVWSAIEWVGNTLLFFLAGLIIGKLAVLNIEARDVLQIIIIYLFLIVLRVVVIGLLYPALYYSGKGCNSLAKAAFISWSGFRGAVSIALALTVYQSTIHGKTKISERDAERLMFLVGGLVALTLLINATTARWILMRLRLLEDMDLVTAMAKSQHPLVDSHEANRNSRDITRKQKETQLMFEYLKKRIRLKAYNLIETTQHHPLLAEYLDLTFIFRHCSVLKNSPEAIYFSMSAEEIDAAIKDDGKNDDDEDRESDLLDDELHEIGDADFFDIKEESSKYGKTLSHKPFSDKRRPFSRKTQSEEDSLENVSRKRRISKEDYLLIEQELKSMKQEEEEARESRKQLKNQQSEQSLHSQRQSALQELQSVTPETSSRRRAVFDESITKVYAPVANTIPVIENGSNGTSLKRKKSLGFDDFIQTRARSLSAKHRSDQPDEFASPPSGRKEEEKIPIEKLNRNSLKRLQMLAFSLSEETKEEPKEKPTMKLEVKAENDIIGRRATQTYSSKTTPSCRKVKMKQILEEEEKENGCDDGGGEESTVVSGRTGSLSQSNPSKSSSSSSQEQRNREERLSQASSHSDPTDFDILKLTPQQKLHLPSSDFPLEKEKIKEIIKNQEENQRKEREASTGRQSEEKKKQARRSLGPSKLLSFRMLHNIVYYDLLMTMRKVFLEVLRVNYFKQINSGQLPRKSFAAILLLNSIDVSLNKIESANDKLEDLFILSNLHYYLKKLLEKRNEKCNFKANPVAASNKRPQSISKPPVVAADEGQEECPSPTATIGDDHFITQLHGHQPLSHNHHGIGNNNNNNNNNHASINNNKNSIDEDPKYQSYSIHLQTVVMILMAFIEAHEFAQSRIVFYLGETKEGIDTPEEDIVICESKFMVSIAKEMLMCIYKPILKLIYSKRILFAIFNLQRSLIEQFVVEGIINMKYSEILYEEISSDVNYLQSLERKKVFQYYYKKIGQEQKQKDGNCTKETPQPPQVPHSPRSPMSPLSPEPQPQEQQEKLSKAHIKLVWIFGRFCLEYYFEEVLNSYHFMKERCMNLIS